MNNNITIVGHVGQNPHAVSFGDTGNKVVKFSVAVKEFSSNSDENKTMWLDVDAWNGLGERVLKTVTKGREVVVNGRLALSTCTCRVLPSAIPSWRASSAGRRTARLLPQRAMCVCMTAPPGEECIY